MGWQDDERYTFKVATEAGTQEVNLMRFVEGVCKLSWEPALQAAWLRTGAEWASEDITVGDLWERTEAQVGRRPDKDQGVRIIKQGHKLRAGFACIHGDDCCGITLRIPATTVSLRGAGYLVETALHEVAHIAHLGRFNLSYVNGRARPHCLTYNVVLTEMAARIWGYTVDPVSAGWSVGRGYAPSKALDKWLGRRPWAVTHCP